MRCRVTSDTLVPERLPFNTVETVAAWTPTRSAMDFRVTRRSGGPDGLPPSGAAVPPPPITWGELSWCMTSSSEPPNRRSLNQRLFCPILTPPLRYCQGPDGGGGDVGPAGVSFEPRGTERRQSAAGLSGSAL